MSARNQRIADQIQRELSEIIRLELRDPRVRLVTLTGVELAADLSHAKVYFSTLETAGDVAAVTSGLQRAAGFLRSELSRRLTVRTVPQLHFAFDHSLERGNRLSALIDEAARQPKAIE
jgi:ribosome-binding factor A